ncbi:mucin-6-like isoform X2 [Ranitomeya imitator]|uniref:mucin-6-like isoform X2 n=1 Tax=Ranitomeya imitator TaxID=111125 RepID=UPI0037E867DF
MKWIFSGCLVIVGLPCALSYILSLENSTPAPTTGQNETPSDNNSTITCPPDAEVYNCTGCWSECPIARNICSSECKEGCTCKILGYFLHNDNCFPLSQCPYLPLKDKICPGNMVWRNCSVCKDYCPVQGQRCIKKCRTGCVCKGDFLLYYGRCIHKSACPQRFAFVPSCPDGQSWHYCAPCESFCFPESKCGRECVQGCTCEDEDLVWYDGKCIKREKCPSLPSQP